MKRSTIVILIASTFVIGAGIWFFSYGCQSDWCLVTDSQKIQATNSYAQCISRGFPVQQTSPKICVAGNKLFIESPSGQ